MSSVGKRNIKKRKSYTRE